MAAPTMTAAEALDRVIALERRHDLLRHTVGGWSVWPLFRFAVARALTGGLPSGGGGQRLSRQAVLRELARHDLFTWMRPRRADVLFKTYSSGLLEEDAGGFRDVWFDDIIHRLGGAFKVEEASAGFLRLRERALTPRDLAFESLELAARLGARTRTPEVSEAAAALGAAIRSEVQSPFFEPRFIAGTLRYFHWLRRSWAALLRRSRPTCVLVADPGEFALVAAAREQKIPIVELQHGIMDRSHPCYVWDDYALPFRERLPLPDRLLLYGEHWKRELDGVQLWRGALRVVGSPRHDRYRAARRDPRPGDPARILVTSQGIERQRLIAFVRALSEGNAGVTVTVKLHPVYDQDASEWTALRASGSARILHASEPPSTFALLTESDLHISISSAVHYDALGLGVPTGVLPFATSDVVGGLVSAGHAIRIGKPDDAVAVALRRERVPSSTSDHYFAANALDRIAAELAPDNLRS